MDETAKPAVKSREYQGIHEKLSLFYLGWHPLLLVLAACTPLSRLMADAADAAASSPLAALAVYYALFSLVLGLVDLPLSFYSGFVLEHRFGLSNQNLPAWIGFQLKKSLLSFGLSLVLVAGLYLLIWRFPEGWWLWAWGAYLAVSILLGKVFPVWILPLFYRYEPVKDEVLRSRILALAKRYGMPVENLYTLNLSKTTKKANAAFMGLGKTKRVVLSDTLLENFTHEEIETVVAHELGHFKHRDIHKQILLGSVVSFAGFRAAALFLDTIARQAGYQGGGDIAALPLLFLIFTLLGLIWAPVQSAFSRKLERAADTFALEALRAKSVFVSCMEKLGKVNLAETSPHPLYEWYFYDHPSIPRRIALAERWALASKDGGTSS